MKTLRDLKKGDTVERLMGGTVIMELKITEVSGNKILCGDWEFDRRNGAEVDDFLGWSKDGTGSYIRVKQ